jgi:hypothetical protein
MLSKYSALRSHAKAPDAVHQNRLRRPGETNVGRGVSPEPVVLVVERDALLRWVERTRRSKPGRANAARLKCSSSRST